MPLYEYQCEKCNCTFDKVMTIREMETAAPLCPECGSAEVKKLMSSGGVKIGLGGYAGKIR
ncbi:MAG: zinc ribbon domain-containing protein [Pseudomonadota bacterium]|jgi:putative FmdB family regulatory protein